MPTGIDGFDEMTHGGLPRRRTVLVPGETRRPQDRLRAADAGEWDRANAVCHDASLAAGAMKPT
jgi:hypothetical protein